MATSARPSELAFFVETTAGTGPADASAWVSNGTRVRHIHDSLDLSGVQQAMLEDMRSQTSVWAEESFIHGLKNTEFPFAVYATGSGTTTSASSQISAIALSTLLSNWCGGIHRSNSTTLSGTHGVNSIEVAATTNIPLGCLIGVEDQDDAGRVHVRRVIDIDSNVLTLDQDLPFTPVDSDIVHGMITLYGDEAVLRSSSAAASRTLSLWAARGSSSDMRYEMLGCKLNLTGITLARGELPSLQFQALVASFLGPNDAADPSWTAAPSGNAPVAVGPDTQVWLEDVGEDTSTLIHVSEFSVEPGITNVPIETVTEVQTGMQGREGYTVEPAATTVTVNVVPGNTAYWDDFDDTTLKQLRWSTVAPAGSVFALHFSRCQVSQTPSVSAAGSAQSNQLVLRARQDSANASASNAALWESKILIGIG